MKKFITTIIVLLVIAGVAVVTCPDKQDHKDAITSVINEVVHDELGVNQEDDSLGILKGLANIGAGIYLDSKFDVKNYFLFSVGTILHGAENDVVSVGVFGHVFTGDKEDFKKIVSGN